MTLRAWRAAPSPLMKQMAPSGPRRSSFPAKSPRFFKIIYSPISQNQKLRIPRDFIKRYGKNLSSLVFLKAPGGDVWPVELINADGNFWLQNGWQEFAEFYSLGYGHLLVFIYDGNCHFHVLIFDMSATEIEYPLRSTGAGQSNPHTQCKVRKMLDDFPAREKAPETKQIKKNVPTEISDDFPSRRTRSKTVAFHGKTRANLTCKIESTTDSAAFFPTFRSRETRSNSVKPAKLNAYGYPNCSTKEIKKECNDDMVTTPSLSPWFPKEHHQ